MNKTIKNYHYYIINEDYTLKKLGVTAPTSEIPILDESEFKALKYSLESNNSPSYTLFKLCELHHEDEISYSFLAKILVNKKRFLVEVFERVDS
ncbi:hypothetical protein [Ligilactobacillus agilis]|uniref:hypothetical protein n=1 Tax=Ligilactobacillus agilis TaxID=1601 RepID=UPI0022E6A62F|nr:hypothetical protein [Ligilactobacillus agilis]